MNIDTNITIGIQILAYNCATTFEELIKPWVDLKQKHDIKIWIGSGQFKTYHEMGCKNLNGSTIQLLKSMLGEGKIDCLFQPNPDNLLDDHKTRDKCIPWMREQDIDLMIQVDADEFYTLREANNLIKYIKDNPNHTCYNTIFRNVIGDGDVEDWSRFSAGWIKKHGGIKHYYFDCHWSFEEGEYREFTTKTIPKDLVNPYHYTWTNDDNTTGPAHVMQKIEYQSKIYGDGCGYEWDILTNKIKKNR